MCEVCKKKEATVHITRILNGKKEESHLCEDCAKQVEGLNMNIDFNQDFNLNESFTFQSILSGIMDYVNKTASNSKEHIKDMKCKNCGITYSEFKQKGILGCSECYKNFRDTLNPVIRRVQGNVEHIGKIPTTSGKDIMKRKKLTNLKETLQKAILMEEYEEAAEIRDEIREIEKED